MRLYFHENAKAGKAGNCKFDITAAPLPRRRTACHWRSIGFFVKFYEEFVRSFFMDSCACRYPFMLYTQLIENAFERKIIEWNAFPCSWHFRVHNRQRLNAKAQCYKYALIPCWRPPRATQQYKYFIHWFNECNFQFANCFYLFCVLFLVPALFLLSFHWLLWSLFSVCKWTDAECHFSCTINWLTYIRSETLKWFKMETMEMRIDILLN